MQPSFAAVVVVVVTVVVVVVVAEAKHWSNFAIGVAALLVVLPSLDEKIYPDLEPML